jgi:hypothetical protein
MNGIRLKRPFLRRKKWSISSGAAFNLIAGVRDSPTVVFEFEQPDTVIHAVLFVVDEIRAGNQH